MKFRKIKCGKAAKIEALLLLNIRKRAPFPVFAGILSLRTAQMNPPHMRAKRICRQRTNCTTPAHVMTALRIAATAETTARRCVWVRRSVTYSENITGTTDYREKSVAVADSTSQMKLRNVTGSSVLSRSYN